jgi:hypothetical protein
MYRFSLATASTSARTHTSVSAFLLRKTVIFSHYFLVIYKVWKLSDFKLILSRIVLVSGTWKLCKCGECSNSGICFFGQKLFPQPWGHDAKSTCLWSFLADVLL